MPVSSPLGTIGGVLALNRVRIILVISLIFTYVCLPRRRGRSVHSNLSEETLTPKLQLVYRILSSKISRWHQRPDSRATTENQGKDSRGQDRFPPRERPADSLQLLQARSTYRRPTYPTSCTTTTPHDHCYPSRLALPVYRLQ